MDPAIKVRAVGLADSRTLESLAGLTGGSVPLPGTALPAERDGMPLAAIRLTSGTVLADPANTTLSVVGR